jgi:hypothetical protein
MPKAAPDGAAPDPGAEAADGGSDRDDGPRRDAEADRFAELAARLDPVPREVTDAARRAWRERLPSRRRARPQG